MLPMNRTSFLASALLLSGLASFAPVAGAEPLKVQSDCLSRDKQGPQVLFSTIPSQNGTTDVLVAQAPMVSYDLAACTYKVQEPPAVKGLY